MRAARLHLRAGLPALSFLVPPSGYLSAWAVQIASFAGRSARYLGPPVGAAQVGTVAPVPAVPANASRVVGLCQFLSDPFAARTIPVGTWGVGFAMRVANAGAELAWSPRAALYVVNGLTGERRATIFNVSAVGAVNRTTSDETSCVASIQGAAAEVFPGDYLCLEVGASFRNSGAAPTSPQAQVFADGATALGADAQTVTDARALLAAPLELEGSLPEWGEQPSPAVSYEGAVELLKAHFPPNHPFDFDDPVSADAELVAALGQVLHVFGYQVVDLLLRELDPRTATQRLEDLEGANGILYSTASALDVPLAQRRAAVLSCLRLSGGTTLFNVAAAISAAAGYGPMTYPEVLELPLAASEAADYSAAVGRAVPERPAALDLYTPQLLDGGMVSEAGVRVKLVFASATVEQVSAELRGPDFAVARRFSVGPDGLSSTVILRWASFRGAAVHGQWRLRLSRSVASAAATLVSWSLHALGAAAVPPIDLATPPVGGGLARQRFVWAVFVDLAKLAQVDPRVLRRLLTRVTQAHCKSYLVFGKDSIPGKPYHTPGCFVVN